MIFHENRLLADDSHEVSYLIILQIAKDVTKFVVCFSLLQSVIKGKQTKTEVGIACIFMKQGSN